MRKCIPLSVALLLTSATSTVWAIEPNDYLAGQGDEIVEYLNPETIKERGGQLSAWVSTDRRTPDPQHSLSDKSLIAFDCAAEQYNYLTIVGYELPAGRGKTLYNETYRVADWQPVVPGTVMAKTVSVVCAVAAGTPIEQVEGAMSYPAIEYARHNSGKNFWWSAEKYHPR